jgi:hypothetical protein
MLENKNKTFNDFLVLNQSLITNMESQSPEIKSAFDLVLQQIKAKFDIQDLVITRGKYFFKVGDKVNIPKKNSLRPGLNLMEFISLRKAKEENQDYLIIQKIEEDGHFTLAQRFDGIYSSTFALEDLVPYTEFKVGDKVKIPLTKSTGVRLSSSDYVKKAKELKQNFLYVNAITKFEEKQTYVLNFELDSFSNGDSFLYEDLVPYEEFKIGDKVKIPTINTLLGTPIEQLRAVMEAKNLSQDYLVIVKMPDGYVSLAPSIDSSAVTAFALEDLVPYEDQSQTITNEIKLYTINNKVEIPQEIVDKMLEYQLEQTGKQDINVFVTNITSDRSSGGFSWGLTKDDTDFWLDILKYDKFDEFYKKYPKTTSSSPITSSQASTVKKPWNPTDLVGKTLELNGMEFYVKKLVRNNPKNKKYELLNVKTQNTVEYNISMSIVEKWLDGLKYRGGKIIDPIVVAQNTSKVTTLNIGDKVRIPLTKSDGSPIEESQVIKRAKEKNQDFLYIIKIVPEDEIFLLNDNITGISGDYFKFSDVIEHQSSIIPKTKIIGDYSTYSQEDLAKEKLYLSDALQYFDETDPEIKEIQNKLEILNVFID